MDSLTGAVIAAIAAWLSIVAAIVLPVPEHWFQRLRWVGAASIAVVGSTLVGAPLPPAAPAVVLGVGAGVALLLPARRAPARADAEAQRPERLDS